MTGHGPSPEHGWGLGQAEAPLPPRIRPSYAEPRAPPLQEAWVLNRERELKEEIRRGRDKDIELVIRRLEADMTLAREESERTAESR